MPPTFRLLQRTRVSVSSCAWLALVLAAVLCAPPAHALRVVSYNVLNVSPSNAASRVDDMRVVLAPIDADLIVAQELIGFSGADYFYDNVLQVLEPGQWSMAPFVDGPDTDNACYYRTSVLDYQSMITLNTALRDINGWVFRPDGYTSADANFRVYSLHLKASTGSDNEQKRLAEATILRNHLNTLPAGTQFFVGGDYNFYDSGEPAWGKLTGSEADNDGRVYDPINRVGNWHNNTSYADVHSQSPRLDNLGDGGSTGGMDDRFDFILANDDLLDGDGNAYIPGSYRTYGQDGLHYNKNITDSPTIPEGATIANALFRASDHLPLFLDMQLPSRLLVSGDLSFGKVLVGAAAQKTLVVENAAQAPADNLDYSAVGSGAFSGPGGSFSVAPGGFDFYAVSVSTVAVGNLNGSVSFSTNAPDDPSELVPATAIVVDASVPSVRSDAVVLSEAADFGSNPQGAFSDLQVEAYNFGFNSLRALLEVYEFEITGATPAFFSVVDFVPAAIGASPGTFTVHFDDAAATEGLAYTAVLALKTRDEQAVTGAQNRSDLNFQLDAFVEPAVPAPAIALRTRLMANFPNPFNPRTTVSFELAQASRVQLEVYDLRGRLVASLLNEERGAGSHQVIWTGKDMQGRAVASGVYLYRLRAFGYDETRRMTLVR